MIGYDIYIIDHINNPVVLETKILPSLWKTIELETIYNIIIYIFNRTGIINSCRCSI